MGAGAGESSIADATVAVLTSDVVTVNADVAAVNAAVKASSATEKSLQVALKTSLKSSQTKANAASNNKLLAALTSTEDRQAALITKAANALTSNAKTLSKRGLTDGKQLLAHPTKTSNQTKVTKDIAALNSIIPAKLSALQTASTNALTAIIGAFSNISIANPSVATAVISDTTTIIGKAATLSAAASSVSTATTKLAVDLGNTPAPVVNLTGVTFFRGDSTGDNISANGGAITRGAWTSGLDVQNVPGNYAAEFFISKVANPTAADFLTPAQIALSLSVGDNKFYFWADSDDTAGGSQTFGLNVFLNGSTAASVSGYTIPGTGQTLTADSAPVTSAVSLGVISGAGTLTTSAGTTGTVTLSAFQVLGVAGQGSTVDLVNSTNTSAFSPPAHADGIMDTYGTFTLTVAA